MSRGHPIHSRRNKGEFGNFDFPAICGHIGPLYLTVGGGCSVRVRKVSSEISISRPFADISGRCI